MKFILTKPKHLQLDDKPCKTKLIEHTAQVKVHHVALCGSDFKLYNGTYGGPSFYPIIPGHEWVGEIVAINPQSAPFKIGDWVTGDCSNWGNNCPYTQTCNYNKNLCPSLAKFGITKDGFLQETAVVPIRHLYRLPQVHPMYLYALTELFAVAIKGVLQAQLVASKHEDDTICIKDNHEKKVLIIGGGAVGIAAAIYLHYHQKKTIAILESSAEKRQWLSTIYPEFEFIAPHAYNPENDYRILLKQTPFDIVLEASGSTLGVESAVNMVNPGGCIILYGMYPVQKMALKNIVCKSICLKGTIGGTGAFDKAISLIHQFPDPVANMITKRIPCNTAQISSALQSSSKDFLKLIIDL